MEGWRSWRSSIEESFEDAPVDVESEFWKDRG